MISKTARPDALAALLLSVLTLFRFWYDTQHQLLQDEAYYWQWSRHLDWGYYDNTPLMALVIRLFTGLLGTNELGVRAGATVCAFIAGLFIYLLAKRLLGPTVALAALVLASVVPLFAAGSVIMTQDPVQLALWAAALYVIQRALTDRPKWWVGAGVLAGLAAEAKLNALLLLPSVFLYILLSPVARDRWLRRPEPYLAGVIALLMLAPFLWWNHTHQNAFWIHAHAMSSRGSGHDGLKWVGRFLGDQAVLLSPFVFLTYLYTLGDVSLTSIRSATASSGVSRSATKPIYFYGVRPSFRLRRLSGQRSKAKWKATGLLTHIFRGLFSPPPCLSAAGKAV